MSQPVPQVTATDVARVMGRDVPAAAQAAVAELLGRYTEANGPVSVPRVHLAVLKLSGGDTEKVAEYVEAARQDYRDVLAWAEYPRYFARGGFRDEDEQRQVIDDDWAEYKAWLDRE